VKRHLLFAALVGALLTACSTAGSNSSKVLDVARVSLATSKGACYEALPTSIIAPDRNNDGKVLASDAWYRMLQAHGYTTTRPYRQGDMMDGNGDNRALDGDTSNLKSWVFTDKGKQAFRVATGEDDHGLILVCFAQPHATSIVSDISANNSFDTAMHTVVVNEQLDWESWVTPSDKAFIEKYYKDNVMEANLLSDPKPGHENTQATFTIDEPNDAPPHLAGQSH
jgi:hypothetical protein